MSIGSAIARKYQYNPKSYSGVLNKIHNKVKLDLMQDDLSTNAQELQEILMEIKQTARLLNKEPRTSVEQELVKQYEFLIKSTVLIHNITRMGASSKGIKKLSDQALFNRSAKAIAGGDNIFEEELAALEAAINYEFNGNNFQLKQYLVGGEQGTVSALIDEDLTEDLKQKILDGVNKTAKNMKSKLQVKKLSVYESQKVDNLGLHLNLDVSMRYDENKIKRLAYLLQDATFTDKQYSRWDKNGILSYSKVQLHLGNTNLYKPITGVISTVEEYSNPNIQRMIFFRGLTILNNSNIKHSATPGEVGIHFTHMRFMYELRGTGIIDKNRNSSIAKYIIYNDPGNTTIFVRDTASIILEELEKRHSNLFGEIRLSASRVNSRKK